MRRFRLVLLLGCVFAGVCAAQAQAAAGIRWHKAIRLEPAADGGVQAVSCPTDRLCVAVDASGHSVFSTRPTRGGRSWSHLARIDGGNALTGVSCPTTRFCVAVDANGAVLSSTRPTRGSKSWSRPVHIDSVRATDGGYAGLLAVSCPSIHLCVAVDGAAAGDILTTTRPTGGAGAWRMVRLGVPLSSVSCPTTNLCVVAGAEHIVSANPTAGRSSWHFTGAPAGGGLLSSIDCPAISLCLGVGFSNDSPGLAVATATPRGGLRTWGTVGVLSDPPSDGEGLLDAVGCAGGRLCVALDTADNAFLTGTPLRGGWSGPRLIRSRPSTQQNAISCTTRICVVVDSAGVETTGVVHG